MTKEKMTWMYSAHYHCRKCGAEVQPSAKRAWRIRGGVSHVGMCGACGTIHTEWEHPEEKRWF